jgi:hypothetical protein
MWTPQNKRQGIACLLVKERGYQDVPQDGQILVHVKRICFNSS